MRALKGEITVAMAGGLFLLGSCQRTVPPGDYDLVAASVKVSPGIVHVGDKVVLDHSVRNDGKDVVPAKTYEVDLYVDGVRVAFDHATAEKGSGSESRYSMSAGHHHWQPTKPGKYRYRLIVDASNRLPETNEANNLLEGEIEVLP